MKSHKSATGDPLPTSPVEEVIYSRRTIRKFKPGKLPEQLIQRLIENAIQAPSASNKQPWRFFVINSDGKKQEMRNAVSAATDTITQHMEPGFIEAFKNYGDYFVRFTDAPCVIAVAFSNLITLSNLVSPGLPDPLVQDIEKMEMYSGLISASLAIQNLLLSAESLGLGSSCMTGPLVARSELKKILEIPNSWELGALVCLGYPDESPKPVTRKNVENIIRWINDV